MKSVNEVMRDVLQEEAIALLGNHVRMMIDANTSEASKNRTNDMLHWLIKGGQKTLDSYKMEKELCE